MIGPLGARAAGWSPLLPIWDPHGPMRSCFSLVILQTLPSLSRIALLLCLGAHVELRDGMYFPYRCATGWREVAGVHAVEKQPAGDAHVLLALSDRAHLGLCPPRAAETRGDLGHDGCREFVGLPGY